MSKRLTAEQVADRLESIEREWQADAARMHANNPSGSVLGAASELRAGAFGCSARMVRDNLIETDEQRRERFERWRVSQCDGSHELAWDAANCGYFDGMTDLMWRTWQAALTWHGETEGGGA